MCETVLECHKCGETVESRTLYDGEPCVRAFCNGIMHAPDASEIESILQDVYGVDLLNAPPVVVTWAAERIVNTDVAIQQLKDANQIRNRQGRPTVIPMYGSRLFPRNG